MKTSKKILQKISNYFGRSFLQIALILWGIGQLYPIIWMFYSSFKTKTEIEQNIWKLPTDLQVDNYTFIFSEESSVTVGTYFKNSILISSFSLILLIIVSALAAYALAKMEVPGKNLIIIILIGFLAIPIHSYLVPLLYFIAKLKLLNRYIGLIFPYIAFNAPFSIALLQAYFRSFPDDIIEAAKVEGCSDVGAFFRVVAPVSMGAISSVLIINFVNIWNEFLFALNIMKNNASKTLPVGLISFRTEYAVDWNYMLAGLVVSIVPTIIFYLFFHKNIIKGMTTGAIKE